MLIYYTLVTVHGYVNGILKREVAGVSYTHNGDSACYFLDIHDISLSTTLDDWRIWSTPPLGAG